MNDKEQLIAIDTNRLNKYLTAWMDEDYREETEVGKCESAYVALFSAGSIERFTGDSIEFQDLSVRDLLADACEFAVTLNLRTVAEDLLLHGGDEKVDLLSELIDERDRFECFLTIASRLAEPMINSGDNSMLNTLSEAGVAALLFDKLFDNDYPEIGAELSESKQWFRALLPADLPEARYWWLYKAEEMASEEEIPVVVIAFPTSSKTVLDNYLNEPYSESGFISAAASSNESPLGELDKKFEGEYNGISFSIWCYKKSDNSVNIEVIGEDGNKVGYLENALCRFQNDEVQVSTCVIKNGTGNCKITDPYNKIVLEITSKKRLS